MNYGYFDSGPTNSSIGARADALILLSFWERQDTSQNGLRIFCRIDTETRDADVPAFERGGRPSAAQSLLLADDFFSRHC